MTSLSEAYKTRKKEEENEKKKLQLGFGALSFGILLVFIGGTIAVSEFIGSFLFGISDFTSRWGIGGILAGIGFPISLIGIALVTPTSDRNKNITYIGVIICFIGVGAFLYAYPHKWHGDPTDLTWLVFLIYTTGSILCIFSIFRSVLDIKLPLPKSPISIRYTGKEENEKQEKKKSPNKRDDKVSSSNKASPSIVGGNDAELIDGDGKIDKITSKGDIYCGNCTHYELKDGESPYCSYHKEILNDLEACEEHEFSLAKAK